MSGDEATLNIQIPWSVHRGMSVASSNADMPMKAWVKELIVKELERLKEVESDGSTN